MALRLKDGQPAFFSPRDQKLRRGFYQIARKYEIQVEELILNHTHLHAVIAIRDRKSYQGFIRELTSKIVSYLSRSIGVRLKGIFSERPFTRIAKWGRGLMILSQYMRKNEKESQVLQQHDSSLGLCRMAGIRSGSDYWQATAQFEFFRWSP